MNTFIKATSINTGAKEIIDDTELSTGKTWSSQKVSDTFDEYTKDADTLSSLNTESGKPVNSTAISGALADYVKINSNLSNVRLGYVAGTMPTSADTATYIGVETIDKSKESLVILGARIIRKDNSYYEYDMHTCGALIWDKGKYQFQVYVNSDMVQYVGGQPIGITYAIIS